MCREICWNFLWNLASNTVSLQCGVVFRNVWLNRVMCSISEAAYRYVSNVGKPPPCLFLLSQKAFGGTTAPHYWSRSSTAVSKKSCPSVSGSQLHNKFSSFWDETTRLLQDNFSSWAISQDLPLPHFTVNNHLAFTKSYVMLFFSQACGNKVDPVYEALRFGTSLAQKAKRPSGSESPHRNSVRKGDI